MGGKTAYAQESNLLLKAFSVVAVSRIGDFKPKDLVEIVSSLATFNFRDELWLKAISSEVQKKMYELTPAELSKLANGVVALDFIDDELLEGIADSSLRMDDYEVLE